MRSPRSPIDAEWLERVLEDPLETPLAELATNNLDQGLAFAYITPEHAVPGAELEVRVIGDLKPARVLGEPAYDPTSSRLRM